MPLPDVQPGILKITPYKGGDSAVEGVTAATKLSSNESPLGPSPKAMAAFADMGKHLHRYPDGGATMLRQALGKHYGLDPERILCSNGSDELIGIMCNTFVGAGDEVLFNRHGFAMYPIATLAAGGTPVMADERDYTADVDALLAKVTPRTRIVFLANPNNPTGTYLPAGEVKRLRERLPANVLLVIDAAYAEYVTRNDYSNGADLVEAHDNVVMMRTFSKIFGLAGLRVGWAYMPAAMVDVLNRVRGPFNVNLVAQHVAVAALNDVAWTDKARSHNDIWLPKMAAELKQLGLETVPSVGNFLLIRFPAAPKHAEAANVWLRQRGIILRPVAGYGLPEFLRLTIGTEEENRKLLAALKEFLAA